MREFSLATENYTEPLQRFAFPRFLANSVFVTVVATLITLLINSMAAYALSIYEFKGKNAAMLMVIGTLMIPITIILVPVYLVVTKLGLVNSLWAVILPGAATPTGVFLLRQYMLTLPRDLIEAARMDKASEWQIYWRIVMPLTLPALAVLAIFSIMWRWNEFLWPLAVLTKTESLHAADRPQRLPGRAADAVALPARDDGDDADCRSRSSSSSCSASSRPASRNTGMK